MRTGLVRYQQSGCFHFTPREFLCQAKAVILSDRSAAKGVEGPAFWDVHHQDSVTSKSGAASR